jgi:hypothetical protein
MTWTIVWWIVCFKRKRFRNTRHTVTFGISLWSFFSETLCTSMSLTKFVSGTPVFKRAKSLYALGQTVIVIGNSETSGQFSFWDGKQLLNETSSVSECRSISTVSASERPFTVVCRLETAEYWKCYINTINSWLCLVFKVEVFRRLVSEARKACGLFGLLRPS